MGRILLPQLQSSGRYFRTDRWPQTSRALSISGASASAYRAMSGIHASAVYAESFSPLVKARPQQLVATRGCLGLLGLQAETGGIALRGFVNAGDACGEEERLV